MRATMKRAQRHLSFLSTVPWFVFATASAPTPAPAADEGRPAVSAWRVLERADVVSLHTPLTDETRHLIGATELARMKSTAVLVNTARGPVVDESALIDALEAGRIFGAGLDVYNAEALSCHHPNLVLTAHMANGEDRAMRATVELAIRNVASVLRDEAPITPVTD